jgi:hypothetical protein
MKESEVVIKMTIADLRNFLHEYKRNIEQTLDNLPSDKLVIYDRGGAPAVDKASIHNEVLRKAPMPKEFQILHKFLI